MAETQDFVVSVRNLTKSYGATKVLKGVDFSVARGEVHALLGGNGAGKSTMIRIITGLASKDGGDIEFRTLAGDLLSEGEGRSKVAVVHQELALLPHLTVAENIVLPRFPKGLSLFDRKRSLRQAHEALSLIDRDFADRSLHSHVGDLSLHQGQMVEIARALSSGAEFILLDEPTANLTAIETERLFAVLRRLTREKGLAIVFVSHRMKEIRQIADVCTIIRDGKTVVDRAATASLSDAAIIEKMGQLTGRPAEEAVAPFSLDSKVVGDGDKLVIRDENFEMELTSGTILGVAGAPIGPQSLVEALVGAAKTRRWTVARAGWPSSFSSPRQAARSGLGFITGDRSHKGILGNLPIVDNVMASRLLVLEEPTRGVDIGTKEEIYQLIRQMAASGTIIVWYSTENAELLEVCDRIVAFDTEGRCAGLIEKDQMSEDTLANMTGMAA